MNEYFEESLVLLKHLVCVPYSVLFTQQLNSKSYPKPPLSENQVKIFNSFFKQDLMLYSHFEQKLKKKIEEFGKEVFTQFSVFIRIT